MGWLTATLAATVLTLVGSQHVSEEYKKLTKDPVGFQRTAVEDAVRDEEPFHGSLPLRTAVEFVPDHLEARRQPLRDAVETSLKQFATTGNQHLRLAVEHRLPPSYGGFDHEAFWLEQLTPPAVRTTQDSLNVLCYLESEAAYREEPFSLLPRAIPAHKCTHLIYGAATLDPKNLTLISRDPEYDIVKGGYLAATGLRRQDPTLRVLISISSSGHGRLFREILAKPEERLPKFAASLLNFIELHDFDGAEIDWNVGSVDSLKQLLRELRGPFVKRGWSLVASLKPDQVGDAELASLTDLLVLRAWHSKRTPEYASSPAPFGLASRFVEALVRKDVPLEKIILGVPLFGWSYKLATNDDGESNLANGYGLDGQYTKKRGQLAYFEICDKLEDPWKFKRHEKNGSYLVLGDQWIGYDDPLSVKIKAAFVKSAQLGGISLHSLDLDDFQGICGDAWPMLDAATKTLGIFEGPREKCQKTSLYSDPDNCSGFFSCFNGRLHRGHCGIGRFYDPGRGRCVRASPEICDPGHSDKYSYTNWNLERLRQKQRLEKLELLDEGPRVVCYLTSWAMYRKGDGKFVPEHLDARLCTDVVYAFAGLNPETLTMHSFDPWADIENNLYQRVTSITGPRVLLALGGWTDSSGDKYSRLVSNSSSRRKFVASAVQFLRKYNFKGLSLEWNYPGCWQSDCRRGLDSDKSNFVQLLTELRREFDQQEPPLTLAVALSGYKEVIDKGYNVAEISRLTDFMTVMTYDYHGAWESRTSHLAPLFSIPGDTNPYYNLNYTLNYLVSLGADRSKIIADIPMYGQSYRLTSSNKTDLGDPAAGPGSAGEYTRQPGMLAYHEICQRIEKNNWKTGAGPSAHNKDQFVSFDNANSILYKGQYLLNNGFGGAAAWTVDLDDFTNRCCQEPFPLLRNINRALGRLLTPMSMKKDCQKPMEPITPVAPTYTPHEDAMDGKPRPTKPVTMSTQKSTTWPTWTEKPSTPWNQGSWTSTASTPWNQGYWTSSTTSTPWNQGSWTSTTTTTKKPTMTTTTKRPVTTSLGTSTPTWTGSSGSLAGSACNAGDYKPDPSGCGTYYRCILGELRREFCAPGLHWDRSKERCDWPATAKCKPNSGSTPTSTPSTTTTTTPKTTFIPSTTKRPSDKPDKECEHGQYYAYPNSCTQFLICVNGKLIRQECGPGLNWNEAKNMCDWAFKIPCTPSKRRTSDVQFKPKQDMQEMCTSGSYSAVPGSCDSYYACLWGKFEEFQCAPGLHFNAESQICDWPSRARCEDGNGGAIDEVPLDPVGIDLITQNPATKPPTQPTTALPSAEISPDKQSPLSGYFKVVCYFTNWAWYRRGIGRYLPENIDHTLCTHIVYGFAVLDYSTLSIKAHDSWADYDNHFYERTVAYKKRGVKVSLALGGWNDSEGDKYSRLVNSPEARRNFVQQALQFVEKYGFDGIDLDWEYPVCWQTDCNRGPKSDKEGFSELLRMLSETFKPRGLLLSSAVSPSKKIIDTGYDVPALAKYLDWIAVMTYDFHGQWDKRTGHVAPMYYHSEDEFYYFNANYSINYWISKGAPARSIVMGMPLYGQAFSINDPNRGTGLNAPASAGHAGEFTRAAGFLAYYEICDRILNKGWQVVQDPQRRMGPYAFKGNQWVGFDDPDMIRQKAQFVRDMGLGGGMVWALDLDDFRGRCGEGPHPLMHTLQQVLAEPPNKHDRPITPPTFGQELEWQLPAKPGKLPVPNNDLVDHSALVGEDQYKVVCYFTNWAWYRQGHGKFLPEDIDADLCSHIIYGFAVLDGSNLVIKSHDPWADIDNNFYERVVAYKKKGKKVLVAIGGWNDSAGEKYSRLANNAASRKRFIENVIKFIEKYNFDGLDLDWEYPVCWQVDCTKGPKSDKNGFTDFVRELSAAFKPRNLLLSSAVSPNKRVIDQGYDVPVLAQYFDWIAVMTYDFHGQWDKKTGHNAPFFGRPDDWEPTFNANFSIHYWIEKGAPSRKLVMGVPLYGQSFSLAERSEHGLNAPTYGGGEAGDDTRARGFLSYYEICDRTLRRGWTVVQDPARRIGPYAYSGDQWVSFDDAEQVRLKSEFIKELNLGGGMVWALDLDDFKNFCGCEPSPLLRTMNRVLRNYPAGPTCKITTSSIVESPPITTTSTTMKPGYHPEQSTSNVIPIETATEDLDAVEVEAGIAPPSGERPQGDCRDKLFIAHRTDCHKYYLCNFGQLTVFTCPNGLVWNKDYCDWPENSKCRDKPEDQSNEGAMVSTEKPSSTAAVTPGQWQEPSKPVSPDQGQDSNKPATPPSENYVEGPSEELTIGGRKMICYFTNWAWYRPGSGKFLPEDIEPSLCTHIVYGFAVLDYERLVIRMHDSWADVDNEFYTRVTSLRKRGIRVLIGLGGWNDSAGDKYSRLVSSSTSRKRFIEDVLNFIRKYGFSGLDLDWEYPVCWQVDCDRGSSSEKESFSAFVRELSDAFRPQDLLLSAAVSPSKRVIDHGYDVPSLAKYLDWIAVMTYDYHGQWDKKTGHVAPLYYYPGDDYDYFNANFSMHYWIKKGAPSRKLVMGLPMYGQSFTLAQSGKNVLQSPAPGPGQAGEFTRSAGFLSFYEICSKVKNNGWNVIKDSQGRIGPYATQGDQWVGYDDISAVVRKANFIKDMNLGGGMIWALDLDDFRNTCNCGKYPLLNALVRGLRGENGQEKDCT